MNRWLGRLKCHLGFHVGHVRVDSDSGMMWFHCTRCKSDTGEQPYDPLAFRADGTRLSGWWDE